MRVASSTPPPSTLIYSRELPLGSQSHSRISSLCVCARVTFVYKPSVNIYRERDGYSLRWAQLQQLDSTQHRTRRVYTVAVRCTLSAQCLEATQYQQHTVRYSQAAQLGFYKILVQCQAFVSNQYYFFANAPLVWASHTPPPSPTPMRSIVVSPRQSFIAMLAKQYQ